MEKICLSNLGMIVTNKCNLNCEHCMRGCKNNKVMSEEVIKATLDQINFINNLCICGGEPTLAVDTMYNILDYAIKNNILIGGFSTTINGSIYSKDFLDLLKYAGEYARKVDFDVSYDQYHIKELNRLTLYKQFMENLKKYAESEYFVGIRVSPNVKLFREGNAEQLDGNLTIDYRPLPIYVTYVGKKKKLDLLNGKCFVGPVMTVNTDGIITECDASIEHQQTIYNYGNVLNDSIEDVAIERGKILKYSKWTRECKKSVKNYLTYN